MSTLPADLETSVFYVHLTREIDAPIERVWEVLTDLPKYQDWNPFVRQMIVTDASKRHDGEQVLAVNKYLLMSCHIPPSSTSPQKPFERITTVDHDAHRLSWVNIDYPQWLLRAERWQTLSTVNGKTRYETWEAFNGVLAYFVNWFVGSNLKMAFAAFADGLKAHSEAQ